MRTVLNVPSNGWYRSRCVCASARGGGMDDKLAQLKQLGELKSQGVLTEAEFAQQKSQILGS